MSDSSVSTPPDVSDVLDPTDAARSVCVCLCVCDRPSLLPDLLAGLERQTLSGRLTLYVADNGRNPAEDVLAAHRGRLDIVYRRVEEPGVSAARNCAMRGALGDGARYLAFLDDDEVPDPVWLEALVDKAVETDADVVCGPVTPVFEATPPRWAEGDSVFVKTGDAPGTANLLLRIAALPAEDAWFQPQFGRIGGSDREFLGRLIAAGARFAVAPDARVREHIPPSRLTLGYLFRVGLRDGMASYRIAQMQTGDGQRSAAGVSALLALRKTAYGLHHLVMSVSDRRRLAQGIRDFGTVAGLFRAMTGRTVMIYGPAAAKRLDAGPLTAGETDAGAARGDGRAR